MNWSARINLAIDYIEQNLDSVVIEDVAAIACCSKFHFHRVFFGHFNVTFAEYVRRRRLTVAAVEVVNSNEKLLDIAMRYGYTSPNAFTRAFRNVHGMNPSKARASQVELASYHRVSFPIQPADTHKMKYRIVERPSFKAIGKSKRLTFDKFVKDGPKYWKEYVGSAEYKDLCQLTNGRPGRISGAPMLSVYFPNEDGQRDEFVDLLGVEVDSENESGSFEAFTIPSASYAEFDCTYRSAMKTNRSIYGEWFSSTGYERDQGKPDIAAYFPIAFRHFSEMGVRWWIPVVKKT